jgi:hypothetical protein
MGNPEFKFHPLADIFPLMEGEEFDDLVADIKANGLLEPIVLYQDQIIDGRNRYRACMAAGIDCLSVKFTDIDGSDDISPLDYVISYNLKRRHLTAEQKQELIAKLLKAKPETSDRVIAKQTKVDHKTVGKARSKLEATGEIPQLKKTVGADGKSRSKRRSKPAATPKNITELDRSNYSETSATSAKPTSPAKSDPIGSPPVRYSEAPTTLVPGLSPTAHFLINDVLSKLREAKGKLSAHDRAQLLAMMIRAIIDPDDIVGEVVRLVEKMTRDQRRDFDARLGNQTLIRHCAAEHAALAGAAS